MPVDHAANIYWATVLAAPSPPTEGLTLTVPPAQSGDFPPVPFFATVSFPGNSEIQAGPDTTEPVTVTAIAGNTLTLVRAVSPAYRRAIRAGDQIKTTLVVRGPGI